MIISHDLTVHKPPGVDFLVSARLCSDLPTFGQCQAPGSVDRVQHTFELAKELRGRTPVNL